MLVLLLTHSLQLLSQSPTDCCSHDFYATPHSLLLGQPITTSQPAAKLYIHDTLPFPPPHRYLFYRDCPLPHIPLSRSPAHYSLLLFHTHTLYPSTTIHIYTYTHLPPISRLNITHVVAKHTSTALIAFRTL
ncbi:hypothetical protein DFJ77DRAFT_209030 [Powellomyces hirtus]|nr:hypothetical protein DFJ77DRAFT_209030 [Powellomyces hirtus]